MELVVELHQVLAGLGGELHVHAGSRTVVGNAVLGAVGGDGLVHGAQLLLDDAEAVGDKLVGGGGDLVLVLDPVLVVDVDHHAEDVLGPLGVDILKPKIDDRCIPVAEGGGEAGAVAARCGQKAGTADRDGPVPLCLIGILGTCDKDLADRSIRRVAISSRKAPTFNFVAFQGKVRTGKGG